MPKEKIKINATKYVSKSLVKFCPFTITPFPKKITVGITNPITNESAPKIVLNDASIPPFSSPPDTMATVISATWFPKANNVKPAKFWLIFNFTLIFPTILETYSSTDVLKK